MSNVSSYTTDTYSLAPFYRVSYCRYSTTTVTSYQAILFHTFGAFLYIALHLLSSVFIYISTQSFKFAITVGLLYLFASILRHYKQCDGIYIVDVETGSDAAIDNDNGHNGYDIIDTNGYDTETETETEVVETSFEGESLTPTSPDPDIREESENDSEESTLKEE